MVFLTMYIATQPLPADALMDFILATKYTNVCCICYFQIFIVTSDNIHNTDYFNTYHDHL